MSPILIMAVTKSEEKELGYKLYSCTMESVDPPLKSCWSEWSSPLLSTRFLK
ncbi:hypothetical protein MtrunA17_Chr5g0438031 [Medicago truncatula]|uniref:Uncharacterized protein n=1 Tax=Medicago truncatula TaxID=3880 RepID=I3S500_MEDTR|nr:unknown [Medicago truncatula]RHN57222.1 hypothetical protein MtrunA17_Chr5g0438031 [Medicago truncatula]